MNIVPLQLGKKKSKPSKESKGKKLAGTPAGPRKCGVKVKVGGRSLWAAAESNPTDRLATFLADNVRKDVPVQWTFHGLSTWPREFRYKVLGSIHEFGDRSRIVARRGTPAQSSLLSAVLGLVGTEKGLGRAAAIREAACEAAALEHADHVTEAVATIRDAYTAAKQACPAKGELTKTIRDLIGAPVKAHSGDAERLARKLLASFSAIDGDEADEAVPRLAYHRECWYRFDGVRWSEIAQSDLKSKIVRCLQEQGTGGVEIKEPLVRDILMNLTGLCSTFSSDLQMPIWLGQDGTARPSPYLSCANGRLNLAKAMKTGKMLKLLPPSPRHFSTSVLGFDYVPAATCSLWTKVVDEILERTSDSDRRIEILQEFFGWTLLPTGLHLEKALVAVGDGENGKSTLIKALRAMLGADNVSSVAIEHLGSEFRLIDVVGKHANIVGDMNRVDNFQEGIFKQLVSGEAVQVNRKHKQPITVVSSAKFVFSTNHLPNINDRSEGVYRRLLVMPFFRRFGEEKRNISLDAELQEELSGIANWCLLGLLRLARQRRFTTCGVCHAALDEHRVASDPFLQFLAEKCKLPSKKWVAKSVLYQQYTTWCKRNTRQPVNSSAFFSRVKKLKGVSDYRPAVDKGRTRAFQGIALIH